MVYKSGQIFLPFCHNTRVSDGRTDRRTEFLSLDRVCITCDVVKTRERICAHNGSKCVKSAKDVPFGGFVKKRSPLPLPASKFWKIFALQKPIFAQNTYISWRKPHQNSYSYSNTKQPMGFQIVLKIWPEVEFWPFLRMRSRKLAKRYMKSWSNFKHFPTCK